MWMLWAFWIEALAFAAYVLWSLWTQTAGRPLRWYQIANWVVYGVALIYGLVSFLGFVRRRLAARTA